MTCRCFLVEFESAVEAVRLPILAMVLLIACSTAQGPIVSKIPDDRREFEIVKVEYSPRRAAATITFSSSFGIFAFDLDPDGRKFKRLTLIVNNQRYCEGLTLQDRSGHTTDLLRLEGVQASTRAPIWSSKSRLQP
jgi:hypothetical protein